MSHTVIYRLYENSGFIQFTEFYSICFGISGIFDLRSNKGHDLVMLYLWEIFERAPVLKILHGYARFFLMYVLQSNVSLYTYRLVTFFLVCRKPLDASERAEFGCVFSSAVTFLDKSYKKNTLRWYRANVLNF